MNTDEIHSTVKWAYEPDSVQDRKARIAIAKQRTGIPQHKLYRIGIKLGCVRPLKKENTRWDDKEIELLRKNAHKSPKQIKKILKASGFERSECSISSKRKRDDEIDGFYIQRDDMGFYSTNGIAKLLGVSQGFVLKWINKGWLDAKKQGHNVTEKTDPWIITRPAIKRFIIDNVNLIPFNRVDKYWLVDLLSNYKADK